MDETYFSIATLFTVGILSMVLTWSNMYFCVSISLTLREVKLSVVSYLTNSIVDQILQELYATHKTLVTTNQFLSPFVCSFWACAHASLFLTHLFVITAPADFTDETAGRRGNGQARTQTRWHTGCCGGWLWHQHSECVTWITHNWLICVFGGIYSLCHLL